MTIEEIDKEIKTLEETRFYLQMKDHWTGEDFEKDAELTIKIRELKREREERA